ncbi:MAG: trypsin-like peptidase domain-containing protein [Elusimicrobiaceae bacterium]|nr:trypsin-like peptidase domain-containing protein [Elusimicrobiaceae bacterium]
MTNVRAKIILGLACVFAAGGILAQVSVLSVTDEDKYTVKEDFSHTFEYSISPLTKDFNTIGKCQATRIARRWFVTAAHCVQSCTKGCLIQMDLLDQPVSAWARVKHTPQKPAIFADPDFSSREFVKHDLALIRLDLDRTPLTYYRRSEQKEQPAQLLSRQQFNKFLAGNSAARSALYHVKSPSFPPLLVFDEGNFRLDRNVSVISIFDGKRTVKLNTSPVHYIKALGYAYTNNFGIVPGMSGSGVMSNTGELVGLISGIFQVSKKQPGTDGPASVKKEFFMFFAFNRPAIEFMKGVMGSDFDKLDVKDAYPGYAKKSRQNYAEIIRQINALQKPPSK